LLSNMDQWEPLILWFRISAFRESECGEGCDLEILSYKIPIHEILTQSGPSDRGKLRAINLRRIIREFVLQEEENKLHHEITSHEILKYLFE